MFHCASVTSPPARTLPLAASLTAKSWLLPHIIQVKVHEMVKIDSAKLPSHRLKLVSWFEIV